MRISTVKCIVHPLREIGGTGMRKEPKQVCANKQLIAEDCSVATRILLRKFLSFPPRRWGHQRHPLGVEVLLSHLTTCNTARSSECLDSAGCKSNTNREAV